MFPLIAGNEWISYLSYTLFKTHFQFCKNFILFMKARQGYIPEGLDEKINKS